MLFKRREPASFAERVRVAVWPRRSWRRSLRYALRRISRMRGSPHAIALGFAAGAAAACTPFVGLQMLSGFLLAWLLGGSLLASIVGGYVANPVTVPFIWLGSYNIGAALLDQSDRFSPAALQERMSVIWSALWESSPMMLSETSHVLWSLIVPMMIGALPIGLLVGAVSYFIVWRVVAAYQARRSGPAQEPIQHDAAALSS